VKIIVCNVFVELEQFGLSVLYAFAFGAGAVDKADIENFAGKIATVY
jgi:hypothetical protein